MLVVRLLLVAVLAAVLPVRAQAEDAPPKLVFDLDLAMADVNDKSLRRSGGRERELKVPYALLSLSGAVNPNLSYRVELNGANDSVQPQPFRSSEKLPFFFPNEADRDYGVTSRPEGQFKVDDYKNTGWDPYIQEGHLRRAFIDLHTAGHSLGLVAGRFFVPIGLQLEELRWFTAKDVTHMQRIDNQVDTGVEFYGRLGPEGGRHARLSAAVISGNGNPYHDYVYFDFTRATSSEDTNSAVGLVGALRGNPLPGLEAAAGFEFNYVGSRIEGDTTVQRSKHYDNKFTVGGRYRPPAFSKLEVFGEYGVYKWGLRDTSVGLLEGPLNKTPIWKKGYYVGADLGIPLSGGKTKVGVNVTREELDRDDSLIAFLSANDLLGVHLGAMERTTIVKVYAERAGLTAFAFYNDLQNPFPQASAIVTISGPFAFQSSGDGKLGFGFRFRTTF